MRRRFLITAAALALATTPGYGQNPDSPPARPGELRIAMGDDLAIAVDATQKPYEVNLWGLGETLTRISNDGKVVLWLAESVTSVDPLTWRVTLRKNARFWDGTTVSAEAVAASFLKNWEVQPDTDPLISKQTEIRVVDAATLEFKTPHPVGNFAYQLSYPQFVVHKNGTVMTGPYRPVAYEPDRVLALEPFREHWKGTPPISRIVVSVIRDREARVQALLSGAVDMAYGLPPELLPRFSPAAYEITSIPSKKLLFVQFNQKRPPFDERQLRVATALAIDRAALLRGVMGDQGAVAQAIFPSHGGVVDAVATPPTSVARAEQLLDEAGWLKGADGVRSKNGQRLAFTLYSFPQVPMMTPLASAIEKQLRPLGYDVTVEEVPNIVDRIRTGEFSVAMRGINTLPTGDAYYLLRAMLGKDGRTNRGGYSNTRLEPLLDDLRGETDHKKRQARSREIQEIAGSDAPYIYLVFVPTTIVTPRGKLQGFRPGPNSQYLIDGTFSVSHARGAGRGNVP